MEIDVTVLICCHGEARWRDLAYSRAYPSAADQARTEVWYEPEMTLANVRNFAAGSVDSEWLCFLDADDELDFGYMDAMARHTAGDALLAPAVKYINPKKATGPPEIPNKSSDIRRANHCVIGTLIRRATFFEAGGFREWPCYEDWDLFLGAHLEGVPIIYVPDAVYKAHVNPDGRNAPSRALAEETYRAIRRRHGLTRR